MLLLRRLFAPVINLIRPVSEEQEQADELVQVFAHSVSGEIDDRSLALQRMAKQLASRPNTLLGSSLSTLRDDFVKLLYSHAARAARSISNAEAFQRTAFDDTVEEDKELELLSFRRRGLPERHPNHVSALADAYWTLISLCLYPNGSPPSDLRTPTVRFFDLSPLYGQDPKPLRLFDGRGMLRPDCFSETSIAPFQSALAGLLILWNRNHNFIAHNLIIRLATANHWSFPPSEESRSRQDDQIFNAAREINIAQFKNTIREDVLKGLLCLSDVDPSPRIDILKDISDLPQGNVAATSALLSDSFRETYFLYQLNPMMSDVDCESMERLMQSTGPADNPVQLSAEVLSQMFLAGSKNAKNLSDLPCFGEKSRQGVPVKSEKESHQHTGPFDDRDLASVIMDAREQPAGPNGGGGQCPTYTMMVDRTALRQQQAWKSRTLNEFRQLYGLKRLTSFEEWNPNPEICRMAKSLYGDVDRLRLYVGLHCEAPVADSERGINSGFGFGFTKTHVLLFDITARIRCQESVDLQVSAYGALAQWLRSELDVKWPSGVNDAALPRVLQRIFPTYFPGDNAYSYFLLATPSAFLDASQHEMLLNRQTPSVVMTRPIWPRVHILNSVDECRRVFGDDSGAFSTTYGDKLKLLTNGYGYLLGFDNLSSNESGNERHATGRSGPKVPGSRLHYKDRQMTMFALIPDKSGTLKRYGNTFRQLTADYIVQRSIQQPDGTFQIDIIADVINNVCTRWVCETLCDYRLGDLISGDPNPDAARKKSTKDMYQEFANLSTFIFKMYGHTDSYEARQAALRSSKYLRRHIAKHIPIPDWLNKDSSPETRFFRLVWDVSKFISDISTAWFKRKELSGGTAQSFLRRAIQANRLIPLPKEDLVSLMKRRIKVIAESNTRVDAGHVDETERDIEVSRVVANVLGLAAVSAVNIPQVCSVVVTFYLSSDRRSEYNEIVKISKAVPESKKERHEINKRISAHIHEALRICLPLGLWRRVNAKTFVRADGFPVEEGDLCFADFNSLHNQSDRIVEPQQVNTERGRETYGELFGMGTHKCPALTHNDAMSFMDQVVPEVIKTIFRLDGLMTLVQISDKTTQGVNTHPWVANSMLYPKVYVDNKGDVSFYPQTLLVKYNNLPRDREYFHHVKLPEPAPSLRRNVIKLIEVAIGCITTIWKVYSATVALYAMITVTIFSIGLGHRGGVPFKLPRMSDAQPLIVDCPAPLTSWDETWSPHLMKGGPQGLPLDIFFNTSLSAAYQLQLYDADQKDMKLAIYVDDILRTVSTDFELDKRVDCGDNAYQCYMHQFSYGSLVVPAGSHSVRISWAGKELLNGTYPNLGKNASRRVLVKRDFCST